MAKNDIFKQFIVHKSVPKVEKIKEEVKVEETSKP